MDKQTSCSRASPVWRRWPASRAGDIVVVSTVVFVPEVNVHKMPNVMAWLDADVPLTLVMDLLDAAGPDSRRILSDEQPTPAQLAWLRH